MTKNRMFLTFFYNSYVDRTKRKYYFELVSERLQKNEIFPNDVHVHFYGKQPRTDVTFVFQDEPLSRIKIPKMSKLVACLDDLNITEIKISTETFERLG